MISVIILSFIKELLITTKSKLYIYHKDIWGAITKAIAVLIGEFTTALVLGVDVNKTLAIKAFGVSIAVFVASISVSYVFDKIVKKHTKEKSRKYKIYFKTVNDMLDCYNQLEDKNIECYKTDNKLTTYSDTKDESRIIRDIVEEKYDSMEIIPLIKRK